MVRNWAPRPTVIRVADNLIAGKFGRPAWARGFLDSRSTEVFDRPSEAGEEPCPQRFRNQRSVSASNIPDGDSAENPAEPTSLEAEHLAVRRDSIGDQLGLVLVNTRPIQHPDGDIIFVHGLGGTSQRTWSYERDPYYFWPPWLSSEPELSRFRIFTFGYNANWKGSETIVGIADFAKDLLLRMLTYATGFDQQSQPIGTYPIMFVAHSMGGLVVKKAYIIGKNDDQYREMISRVFGMVFLATPHKGANSAKLLNTLLSTYPLSSSKIYISELERNSDLLQDINHQFRAVCEELKLVSFYETRKTHLRVAASRIVSFYLFMYGTVGVDATQLVEKESAVLGYPREKTSQLDADHHGVCKFKNPDDPKYILVRNMLKWLAASIQPERDCRQPQRTNTLAMVGHLEGVLGIEADPEEGLHSIQSQLTPGSCEWISRRADFIRWAQTEESDQSPRMFHLIGLPATGKTAVASYVVSFLQGKFRRESCQYHFFPSGDEIKRTGTYILRSIAFQIARVHPGFRSKLFELYETESMAFEHQKLLTIWEKIFQGILFKMDVGVPLFWVLDALDETDSSDLLLRLFNKFRSKTLIKIFAVSRPSATLPQMTMSTEDTLGDIKTYVERAVQDTLMVDDQVQKEIVEKVLGAADGSFLWVGLCLEELRTSCHTQDDIQRAITDMPQGMEPMYRRMIHSVAEQPERNRKIAARILTWTAWSYRPLHISELGAALEHEFGGLVSLERTIAQTCGHLVRVRHSEVTPLHETVRAFLQANPSTLSTSGPQGHEYLALTCIQYLSNDRWRNLFTKAWDGVSRTRGTKEERHRQVESLEAANPFLPYAASNWAFHVSKSNPNSHEVLPALAHFLDVYCLSWINGIALSDKLHPIIHTAQYLKAYARKRAHIKSIEPQTGVRMENVGYLHSWAVDLIQLVGHFGANLIQSPTAIYRRIPPFCPRESMIARASNRRGDRDLISVAGLSMPNWNDCLARVIVSEDQNVSRVLSTERHLVTLIAVTGTVVVWSTETFKEMGRMLHREFVTAVALNKSATLLVTAGSRTVKTWKLSTMTEIYSVPRPFLSRTMAIAFGAEDTEILSARDDCTIVCFDLQTGGINWDFVAAGPEEEDRSCPRLMVFSPHQSYIAIGFSGKPVAVWELSNRDKQRPRRCIVAKDRQKGARDVYATPLAICWEPEGTSFLVLYHNSTLVRWHLLDEEQETFTHIRAREMTISEDGNLLLTSDYNGSISVWTCHRFHLLYQLNQDDLVRDMTFSPDAQRFYDLRGSMCHVWEPDELVRADDVESDHMSLSGTSLVAEPIVHEDDDTRGHITALACDEAGAYFCCGKDDGSVAIHEMSDGKRVRKVYSHSLTVSVIALAWSPSGRYMVSADDSSRIICKRLERRESKWAVFPVFDNLRVDGSVHQFLFSKNEKMLLISTASIDIVYELRAKQERCRRRCQEEYGKRWVTHPKDDSLIIAISPFDTYMFTWSRLELLEMSRRRQRIPSISINELEIHEAGTDGLPSPRSRGRQESPGLVQWITLSLDRRHLICSIQPNIHNLTLSKSATRLGRLSISKPDLSDLDIPLCEPIPDLPGSMRRIIGCAKDEIAFLDDDFRFCTWKIGTPAESAKWHFFVPRDWLSPLSLQLAKINAQGAFLCPKNGEVAIVRLNSEW